VISVVQPVPTAEQLIKRPRELFGDATGDWFVLHCKSRQEKALSDDLSARRVPHYLPLMRQVRYHGRRKAVVEAPIFPGYLFLRGTLEQVYTADRTRRVANILKVANQPQIDWELGNLWLALAKEAPVVEFPYLQKGIRVEVRSGPFRGLQGIVQDRLARQRIMLQIDMLGRAVSLEIDGALLEPI
jgi:transcription antitermination factor NusG